MNLERSIWISLGSVAAASIFGIVLTTPFLNTVNPDPDQYLGWARSVEPVIVRDPITVDEHVQALLPTLFNDEAEGRAVALDALAIAFANGGTEELTPETREEAAGALVEIYAESDGATKEGIAERKKVLDILITKLGGDTARAFTAQIVSAGAENGIRGAALTALASKEAFRDQTVDALALEALKGDDIPDATKPMLLRRIKGSKAEAELLELLQSDIDDAGLRQTAVEIQNLHKPAHLGTVISRLDARGLLGDADKMPWFSGKLLSQHIRTAGDAEFMRALKVVWRRPSLTRGTFAAAQARLADADPMIRRMVARLVPDAVKYDGIDAQTGESLLSARLLVEQDASVKGQLEGSLGEVRKGRMESEPAISAVE